MLQYLKNMEVPTGKVDVVPDTDAFNEIDDQFAIAYLLANTDKLNLKAIYAAPFLNKLVETAKEGMEKSYDEILRLLDLMERTEYKAVTYKGSPQFLENEITPVESEAAEQLATLAEKYSEMAVDHSNGTVFISHGDCLKDAELLASMLKDKHGVEVKIITDVGPVIGAHSGPGTLALFFVGTSR